MAEAMIGISARLAPGLMLIVATLVCAMPWGELAGILGSFRSEPVTTGAMLPLAVICAWELWRPGRLSALAAFLAGLLADALTAGPLGYWSLLNLLALVAGRAAANLVPRGGFWTNWLLFAIIGILLVVVAGLMTSLYQLRLIEWRSLAVPGGLTLALFPFAAVLVRAVARWTEGDPLLRHASR